jgi:hypothetical protein
MATVELQENCETALNVEILGVLVGLYDVYVDGALVGTIDAADDGLGVGTGTGFVRFDPTPDAGAGELLLDFAVGTGSLVEVFNEGEGPPVDLPVLSGTLL